jgi:hypothetical protein
MRKDLQHFRFFRRKLALSAQLHVKVAPTWWFGRTISYDVTKRDSHHNNRNSSLPEILTFSSLSPSHHNKYTKRHMFRVLGPCLDVGKFCLFLTYCSKKVNFDFFVLNIVLP